MAVPPPRLPQISFRIAAVNQGGAGVKNRRPHLPDGIREEQADLKKKKNETNVKCLFTAVHFSDLIGHTR